MHGTVVRIVEADVATSAHVGTVAVGAFVAVVAVGAHVDMARAMAKAVGSGGVATR